MVQFDKTNWCVSLDIAYILDLSYVILLLVLQNGR